MNIWAQKIRLAILDERSSLGFPKLKKFYFKNEIGLVSKNYEKLFENHTNTSQKYEIISNKFQKLSNEYNEIFSNFYKNTSISYYINRIESFRFKPVLFIFSFAEVFFRTTYFSIKLVGSLLMRLN